MKQLNRARVDAAIKAIHNTAFECGEWDRNESDETYDTVLNRLNKAEARLRKMLEPYLTPRKEN